MKRRIKRKEKMENIVYIYYYQVGFVVDYVRY